MNRARQPASPARKLAKSARILLLSCLLPLACGDPDTPRISGTWTGEDDDNGSWELELSGSGSLSGTYVLTHRDDTAVLRGDVSGQYDYPAVSLDFQIRWFADRIQACEFRGTMAESGETIAGGVTCSGDGQEWRVTVELRRG